MHTMCTHSPIVETISIHVFATLTVSIYLYLIHCSIYIHSKGALIWWTYHSESCISGEPFVARCSALSSTRLYTTAASFTHWSRLVRFSVPLLCISKGGIVFLCCTRNWRGTCHLAPKIITCFVLSQLRCWLLLSYSIA